MSAPPKHKHLMDGWDWSVTMLVSTFYMMLAEHHTISADIKTKKSDKKAGPRAQEAKESQDVAHVPLKKPKKQQAWDKEGQLHYWEVSKYVHQGKQAAMIAMGLEPVEMLPFPNPDIKDENVTTDQGDVAALKLAWQQTHSKHSAR